MAEIVERLRSRHLFAIGNGVPELCEEAAREIEDLRKKLVLFQQASEYLSGNPRPYASVADWDNDT